MPEWRVQCGDPIALGARWGRGEQGARSRQEEACWRVGGGGFGSDVFFSSKRLIRVLIPLAAKVEHWAESWERGRGAMDIEGEGHDKGVCGRQATAASQTVPPL